MLSSLRDELQRITLARARELQERLRHQVREEPLASPPRTIAGIDVAYAPDRPAACAAIVVNTLDGVCVEVATAACEACFPYVPGFLAWRELPAVLLAWEKLAGRVDLVLADAHGRAHPRRCGLACTLGVLLDVPTIGCAKSVLTGCFGPLGAARGSRAPLVDGGEVIGAALRTRSGVRPVFVSVGHRITLDQACDFVLAASRCRIPEPLRAAHHEVTRLRALAAAR